MALNKQDYIDKIAAGFLASQSITGDPTAQSKAIYTGIVNAIMQAFEDADIPLDTWMVPMGIPVTTAGTPAAQTGATTAPGTITGNKKLL
jgi:hypothetical protein